MDRIEKFLLEKAGKYPASTMARAFGIPDGEMPRILGRLGIAPAPEGDRFVPLAGEDLDGYLVSFGRGLPAKDAGKRLGLSRDAVSARRKELGIQEKPPRPEYSREHMAIAASGASGWYAACLANDSEADMKRYERALPAYRYLEERAPCSAQSCAAATGVPADTVSAVIQDAGFEKIPKELTPEQKAAAVTAYAASGVCGIEAAVPAACLNMAVRHVYAYKKANPGALPDFPEDRLYRYDIVTPARLEAVRDLIGKKHMSDREAGDAMGLSAESVIQLRRVLGMPKRNRGNPSPSRKWTPADEEYLKEHYGTDGPEACARALSRKTSSVRRVAAKLGLPEPENRKKTSDAWTAEEDGIVRRALEAGSTVKQIAAALPGRTVAAVSSRTARLVREEGLPPPVTSPVRHAVGLNRERMLEMLLRNVPLRDMLDAVGLPKSAGSPHIKALAAEADRLRESGDYVLGPMYAVLYGLETKFRNLAEAEEYAARRPTFGPGPDGKLRVYPSVTDAVSAAGTVTAFRRCARPEEYGREDEAYPVMIARFPPDLPYLRPSERIAPGTDSVREHWLKKPAVPDSLEIRWLAAGSVGTGAQEDGFPCAWISFLTSPDGCSHPWLDGKGRPLESRERGADGCPGGARAERTEARHVPTGRLVTAVPRVPADGFLDCFPANGEPFRALPEQLRFAAGFRYDDGGPAFGGDAVSFLGMRGRIGWLRHSAWAIVPDDGTDPVWIHLIAEPDGRVPGLAYIPIDMEEMT